MHKLISKLRAALADISYANRRMFEIRTGIELEGPRRSTRRGSLHAWRGHNGTTNVVPIELAL
jgi:hypothetical protein